MANPKVRPYLTFYPEDAGETLKNTYQADKWLREMEPELLTPMVEYHNETLYVFEPCILSNKSVVMPVRWFKRHGSTFAIVYLLYPDSAIQPSGWVVYEFEEYEISVSDIAVSFPFFCGTFQHRSLPDPRNIIGDFLHCFGRFDSYNITLLGTVKKIGGQLTAWTRTDPAIGNKWRAIGKGHKVYAFPIWLYCDDTSGNSSKRWNKHNSYLFIPAGLDQEHLHLEYNVHFISTSNISPPLEMLDAIVDQLLYVIHLNLIIHSTLLVTVKSMESGPGTVRNMSQCFSYRLF